MHTVFLAYIDQARAVMGLLAICFLFCRNAAARRERFGLRVTVCVLACLAVGFVYVPLQPILANLPRLLYGLTTALYWLTITGMSCGSIYYCYEVSVSHALFRTIMGYAQENLATTLLRYLLVMMWQPELPEQNPAAYFLFGIAIYGAVYYTAYRVLARHMQQGSAVLNDRLHSSWQYALALLAMALGIHATSGICEWIIPTMGNDPTLQMQCQIIRYFCIGIRLMITVGFTTNLHSLYDAIVLQYERDMINQLLRQKSAQYSFNRENIELIQRKCHDLKRQLRALELAGTAERRAVMEETRRAAEFYDATVQIGNEVLDTLLTEKNLLCVNRGIRLTCTVSTKELDGLGVVDLYTMLSNALDNAIECADKLTDPEKKTISFSLTERGRMLCIAVENYYEGTIHIQNGFPITQKEDKANHGIGLRSIQTLAKRYGGDIRISTEHQTFLLQIVLSRSAQSG